MSILNVNKINPVGGGSTITIAGIASVTSTVTAPSFVGAVTGNVTGNVTGDATGLSGNPSINTTGIVTATSFIPTVGQLSHRNLVTNGAMMVSQRGTSFSGTAQGYTLDRMQMNTVGNDEIAQTEQASVTSGGAYTSGFRKCMKIINGNQTSGAGAGDVVHLKMVLEAQDIANSGWNYTSSSSFITLSFWIKSSVAQDFPITLRSEDGTRQVYNMTTGSLTADTWTKVTKTIPGNSNLQFDDNNAAGLTLFVNAFVGTDYTTGSLAQNAWSSWSGAKQGDNMTSTWYTTNNATLEITGIQLEVGPVATPFEHRNFGDELRRCQRYYFRLPYQGVGNSGGVLLGSGKETGSTARVCVIFPAPMRAIPSCAASNLIADDETSATSANTINQVLASSVEPDRARIQFTGGSYSSGNSISLATNAATNSYLEGSAEL